MFSTVAAQANLTIAVTGLPSNVTASGFLQPTDVVLNDVRAHAYACVARSWLLTSLTSTLHSVPTSAMPPRQQLRCVPLPPLHRDLVRHGLVRLTRVHRRNRPAQTTRACARSIARLRSSMPPYPSSPSASSACSTRSSRAGSPPTTRAPASPLLFLVRPLCLV